MEARIVEAQLLLEVQQLARLLLVEVLNIAKLLGEQQDSTVGVKNLGLPIRFRQIFAKADRAVVLKDDRICRVQERRDSISE